MTEPSNNPSLRKTGDKPHAEAHPADSAWTGPTPAVGAPTPQSTIGTDARHDMIPAGRPPSVGSGSSATGESHVPGSVATAAPAQDATVVISESPLVWPELAGQSPAAPGEQAGYPSAPLYPAYPQQGAPSWDGAAQSPMAYPAAAALPRQPGTRVTEAITCPQCGTVVQVDPRMRSSLDFCPNPTCDYPLFWVKSAIVAGGEGYGADSSHRRLPGTVGRVAAAYLPCPHCLEPNELAAVTCVRCGLDMHPMAIAPPPPPPPLPEPVFTVEEPKDEINWWLIILSGIAITLFVAFVVIIALNYLGS